MIEINGAPAGLTFDAKRFEAAYAEYAAVQAIVTVNSAGLVEVTSATEAAIPEGLTFAADWLNYLIAQGYVLAVGDEFLPGERRPEPLLRIGIEKEAVQGMIVGFTLVGGILVILAAILAAIGLFVVPAAAPAAATITLIAIVLAALSIGLFAMAGVLTARMGRNGVYIEILGDPRAPIRIIPRN